MSGVGGDDLRARARRWRLRAAALGAVAAVAAAAVPAGAPHAQGADCPGADSTDGPPENLAAAALCLVEGARRDAGLALLDADGRLRAAAQAHAEQMVATDTFATTMPDGSTPRSRAAAAGYDGQVGEVVAAGGGDLGTPRHVVDGWLANPSQRAIVLAGDGLVSGAGGARTSGGRLGPGANVYALMVGRPNPAAPAPPLRPQPGRSVVATLVSGVVTVGPGPRRARAAQAAAVQLHGSALVPLGATIDATRGRVQILAAKTSAGTTEQSDFYSGAFVPTQRRSRGRLLTVLKLAGGDPRACAATASPSRARAVAAARRKRRVRLLWGDGKAHYRTQGKYASATVRGTRWMTEDRCDGTLVRVARGVVRVRNLRTGATRDVRAGHSTLIAAR